MQSQGHCPDVSAGQFITGFCLAVVSFFATAGVLSAAGSETELPVLVEAEGFADTGGWVIDPQFMDLMGSPYLLAHGLGVPVSDASSEVNRHATIEIMRAAKMGAQQAALMSVG